MLRDLNNDWRRVASAAYVLSACVFCAATSHAQTPHPQTEAGPAEDISPKEITSADFALEANAVEDRLSQIQSELSIIDVVGGIGETLDSIKAESVALQARFESLSTRRMMSSELNTLLTELELLDTRAGRQIDKLSLYGSDLEKLATQNEADVELWARALRSARGPAVPKAARDRTASILHGLRTGRKELEQKLNEVLSLQSKALDVRDGVRLAKQGVTVARRQQADNVFQRQTPPIWKANSAPADDASREGYQIGFSWPKVSDSLRTETGIWASQLLLALLLGWLFTRTRTVLRQRVAKREGDGGMLWEDQGLEALRHPWAAALLIALFAVRFFYPDRVVDFIVLTWIVSLPIWFVVYKELISQVFRTALVGLGLLGTLHIVVALVSGHPGLERALLLTELSCTAAGAAWFVRFLRNADVSKRVREGLWFSAAGLWTRFVFLLSIVGVSASLLGYAFLAGEAAMVAIMGTIAASVAMALSRILEAVVSTNVYLGRFDSLRMIRANRDLTVRTFIRTIRLLAFALFLWALTDMTSAWRPAGRAVTAALSSDLGFQFAETGVTFGDLFSFFFMLWLSWMLARVVSFVLQEEFLPRLHMKAGVPYALTTFTRYAIIVIGFVAALSILGVSLDRVTIVFSALGVGIGFGLQGLVNNVVSGFVLLTERPIRLRDKVEIDNILGNVSSIGIRASTIRTFDGAEVIVPNGDLISGRVVNWTLSARRQRVTIPLGVAYGTDPNQVLGILRKLAEANDKVFTNPAPLALFRGFGDSALNFELRIFMDPSDVLDVPSAVSVAINDALKEAGIEIPFPQRDLNFRNVPDGLLLAGEDSGEGKEG